MQTDLTPHALVNAGGGLAFALFGAALLLLPRRTRRLRLLAALCLVYGVALVLENVLVSSQGRVDLPLVLLVGLPLAAYAPLSVALARDLAGRDERARAMLRAGVAIVLVGLALAAVGSAGNVDKALRPGSTPYDVALVIAFVTSRMLSQGGLGILLAVCGVAAARAADARERHALAGLALGFGVWWSFDAAAQVRAASYLVSLVVDAWLFALVLAWLPRSGDGSRLRLVVTLTFVACGLAGLAYAVATAAGMPEVGAFGVARMLGLVALALSVFRHDLLGLGLAPRTIRRGTLATLALAALFIVAQVAQNFFAAQYGLLMGGVVAGAFLFAAHPLQRAFEGRDALAAARSPGADAQTHALAQPDARAKATSREERYRNALRLALRDRVLTRDEEVQLHELAEELGIGAGRAHAILVEVEREARAR